MDSFPFLLLIIMVNQIKVPFKNLIVKRAIIVIIIKSSNFIPLIIMDSFILKVIPIHPNFTYNSTIKITLDYPSYLPEEDKIINLIIITITKVVISIFGYIT